MLVIVQKLLEISMRLDGSESRILRMLGRILGIFPVHYSRWLEKRLFRGTWDPVKKYRSRPRKNKRSRCKKCKKNQKG